jgi:hypothetical protein
VLLEEDNNHVQDPGCRCSHDGSCCAFAQSFYVVQDVKSKKCTITETKPTSSEVTVVSGDGVYKTRTEAEAGMKTVKVCTTN